MNVEAVKNSVRSYLASNHMLVDDDWLTGCVEFLTEDSSSNYSEREIQNLAKEQWLLNDLKDISPGSLPANLKNKQKTTLTGRYALQINAALDIGTPAYQQYLKLQKVNTENIEATTRFDDKIPCHRMIKLFLTDGMQEISAIEYKPMRNISVDITPGCKVLIKGPVECRRGVLLLTETNIELLGGEVQEISISNSLAGLLSSKLGLPMTQEPTLNTTIQQPRNSNIPTPHTTVPSRLEDTAPHFEEPRVENARPIARVAGIPVNNTIEDDLDIDIDQIAAIEAQLDNPIKRSAADSTSNSEKRQKMDSRNTAHDYATDLKNTRHDYPTDSRSTKHDYPIAINSIDDYPNEDDLFLEDEEHFKEMEASFDAKDITNSAIGINRPVKVSAKPFVYIKQINGLSDREKAGRVFRVKAQIIKLLSKLSVGKDGWSLKCTLIDGTGSIQADFTSAVLSELVGITPQEMNHMKKQMAAQPDVKEKAFKALQKAKDSLQVLYCIVELTMLDVPKITALIQMDNTHVELLKKRTENTRL